MSSLRALPITVDAKASIPISTQIFEQLKLLISIGYLKPGDILPTVIQLAEDTSSNHTTVASVYSSLIEAGYLIAKRGRGTFIAQNEVVQGSLNRPSFYSLLDQAFLIAEQMKLTPSEFSGIAYAKAVMLSQQSPSPLQSVFIECDEHDSISYFQDIRANISGSLLSLKLEDLKVGQLASLEKLRSSELVITTVDHIQDVFKLTAPKQEVIGVRPMPDLKLITEISNLPLGTEVLLVCRGLIGSRTMKRMLVETGISHVNFQTAGLNCIKQNCQILNKADFVYASQLVYEYVYELTLKSKKVVIFRFGIDQASAAVLKARSISIELKNQNQRG